MKSTIMLVICRLLVVSMMFLSMQSARAGMIGVDQVMSAGGGQADRAAVLAVVNRSEVARQLQAMGVDPQQARDRVAALSDEEIRGLAGKLSSLPAGANGGDWGWGLAAVIVIAAIIYYFYGWKR